MLLSAFTGHGRRGRIISASWGAPRRFEIALKDHDKERSKYVAHVFCCVLALLLFGGSPCFGVGREQCFAWRSIFFAPPRWMMLGDGSLLGFQGCDSFAIGYYGPL